MLSLKSAFKPSRLGCLDSHSALAFCMQTLRRKPSDCCFIVVLENLVRLWWKHRINIVTLTKHTPWNGMSRSPREHASAVQLLGPSPPTEGHRPDRRLAKPAEPLGNWPGLPLFPGKWLLWKHPLSTINCLFLLSQWAPHVLTVGKIKSICAKRSMRETKRSLCFVYPRTRQKEREPHSLHS